MARPVSTKQSSCNHQGTLWSFRFSSGLGFKLAPASALQIFSMAQGPWFHGAHVWASFKQLLPSIFLLQTQSGYLCKLRGFSWQAAASPQCAPIYNVPRVPKHLNISKVPKHTLSSRSWYVCCDPLTFTPV